MRESNRCDVVRHSRWPEHACVQVSRSALKLENLIKSGPTGLYTRSHRAAPASRARMTGSLRSRRWPPAPPWRRPPTTSAALLRTLSSLGQPEVAGHSNGRAGQAASRLFPQRSEHVRPRVYTDHTRAAAHVHPRRPNRARSISAPPELSATGPRGADRQVRRMGRARRPQPSHGHWAANRPGRARRAARH